MVRFAPHTTTRLAFWSAVVLMLLDRLLLVVRFGGRHTGTDDVIFWNVAADMAQGIFREPFLYGQNYNPALESLLAVPLLWAQVPMWWAMPVVTSLLALAPFMAFGFWCLQRNEVPAALAFVAIPVLLPVEWGLITTITRGFVTGIAMLAVLPWLSTLRTHWHREVLVGATLLAALAFNPNALLFAVPFAIHIAWSRTRPLVSILHMALGALPVAGLHFMAVRFYVLRPERIVHRLDDWRLTFQPTELIPEAVQQLDKHLAHLNPVWWGNGHVVLYLIALLAVLHWRRGRGVRAWAIAAVFPLLLIALAFPKVHDGFNSVFFPFTRMYLALPLLLAWCVVGIRSDLFQRRTLPLAIVGALLFFFLLKAERAGTTIAHEMTEQAGLPVREFPLSVFLSDVAHMARLTAQEEAGLLVLLDDEESKYRGQLLAYGGPTISHLLPPTLYSGPDRRYWRRHSELQTTRHTILFVGGYAEHWQRLPPTVTWQELEGPHALSVRVVRGNDRPLKELLTLLGHGGPEEP